MNWKQKSQCNEIFFSIKKYTESKQALSINLIGDTKVKEVIKLGKTRDNVETLGKK